MYWFLSGDCAFPASGRKTNRSLYMFKITVKLPLSRSYLNTGSYDSFLDMYNYVQLKA
jgi:hypothetical protein